MKFKSLKIFLLLTFFITVLSGCTTDQVAKIKAKNTFKHNTPLIKEDVRVLGKKEIEKSAEMGPTPIEGDVKALKKRKKISSVKEKNYLLIQY